MSLELCKSRALKLSAPKLWIPVVAVLLWPVSSRAAEVDIEDLPIEDAGQGCSA